MTTTWTIAIDWDRNGNYSDTYDDVTDRVISANWFLGMRKPYQTASAPYGFTFPGPETGLSLVTD